MHYMCIVVWGILGELTKPWLTVWDLIVLGASKDYGKEKAQLYTSSLGFMFERYFLINY